MFLFDLITFLFANFHLITLIIGAAAIILLWTMREMKSARIGLTIAVFVGLSVLNGCVFWFSSTMDESQAASREELCKLWEVQAPEQLARCRADEVQKDAVLKENMPVLVGRVAPAYNAKLVAAPAMSAPAMELGSFPDPSNQKPERFYLEYNTETGELDTLKNEGEKRAFVGYIQPNYLTLIWPENPCQSYEMHDNLTTETYHLSSSPGWSFSVQFADSLSAGKKEWLTASCPKFGCPAVIYGTIERIDEQCTGSFNDAGIMIEDIRFLPFPVR